MKDFKSPGPLGLVLIMIGLLYALTSTNPTLTTLAVITPFILMKLTWRNGEAPILFMAMITQYMAIVTKVFYANFSHLPFDDFTLHRYPEHIIEAFYFGIGGLIALAFGIYLAIKSMIITDEPGILSSSEELDGPKLSKLYLIMAIAYPILFKLSFSLGGLQQPLSKLIEFKWAVFFLFMIYAFHTNNKRSFWLIAIMELLFSFTGFFSGFKDYFLILFIGMILVYGKNLKISTLIPMGAVLIAGFYILIIWQYVKPTYREFLNAGSTSQASVRSSEEALSKLFELVSDVDSTGLNDGFERTVDRLSYIEFLSATMANVPYNVEHTNGALWGGAIERILMPRILFPKKTAIDDSEKARLYTGQEYSGAETGTSISLGYFAESYVDFGRGGMLLILMVFGYLIGKIYRYVLSQSPNLLIGTALTIPLFFVIFNYEKALDKIFGALLMYLIMYLIVKTYLLDKVLVYLKKT